MALVSWDGTEVGEGGEGYATPPCCHPLTKQSFRQIETLILCVAEIRSAGTVAQQVSLHMHRLTARYLLLLVLDSMVVMDRCDIGQPGEALSSNPGTSGWRCRWTLVRRSLTETDMMDPILTPWAL